MIAKALPAPYERGEDGQRWCPPFAGRLSRGYFREAAWQDVPKQMMQCLQKCLQEEPEKRPVAEDLIQLLYALAGSAYGDLAELYALSAPECSSFPYGEVPG
jgi:hypothetical protein